MVKAVKDIIIYDMIRQALTDFSEQVKSRADNQLIIAFLLVSVQSLYMYFPDVNILSYFLICSNQVPVLSGKTEDVPVDHRSSRDSSRILWVLSGLPLIYIPCG